MVRAEAAFKPVATKAATPSEWAIEKERFDKNRERLKSERLAREAMQIARTRRSVRQSQGNPS